MSTKLHRSLQLLVAVLFISPIGCGAFYEFTPRAVMPAVPMKAAQFDMATTFERPVSGTHMPTDRVTAWLQGLGMRGRFTVVPNHLELGLSGNIGTYAPFTLQAYVTWFRMGIFSFSTPIEIGFTLARFGTAQVTTLPSDFSTRLGAVFSTTLAASFHVKDWLLLSFGSLIGARVEPGGSMLDFGPAIKGSILLEPMEIGLIIGLEVLPWNVNSGCTDGICLWLNWPDDVEEPELPTGSGYFIQAGLRPYVAFNMSIRLDLGPQKKS